jgi:hypothetical protein
MALVKARIAWRKLEASARLGFIGLLAIGALAAIFFALAVAYRPSIDGPAQIPFPRSPTLTIRFPGSRPLRDLYIYSFLEQTRGSQASLVLNLSASFSKETTADWSIGITDFRGNAFEVRKPSTATVTNLGNNSYYLRGTSPATAVPGSVFLVAILRWNNSPPLTVSGSYISAALPTILAGQAGTVTRKLELHGTSLSTYTLAGGLAPTQVTPRSWAGTSALSGNNDSQASVTIPVIASSVPGIQHDNHNAFLSGIFFGVAGGAAVSLVPALLDAIDRSNATGERSGEPGSRLSRESPPSHDAPAQSSDDPAAPHSSPDVAPPEFS